MKRRNHSWLVATAVVAVVNLTSTAPMVGAQGLISDYPDTCTTTNCNSQLITGVITQFNQLPGRFVTQVYASAGQCLRLDVTFETQNLTMHVFPPSGLQSWYNLDSGKPGCSACPLVKIGSTPAAGFYTVVVRRANEGLGNDDFELRYGRYNAGNPNCSAPN